MGDHPALAYYRFVPLPPRSRPFSDDYKTKYIQAVARRFDGPGPWREACAAYAVRHTALGEGLKAAETGETFVATTATRLLVGMGYKNALEVGLTFHHPGGFPYLPGTSVKGLCRAWAEDGEDWTTDADRQEALQRVFGSASKRVEETGGTMEAGSVCFLDALPLEFPTLDPDLLNPHYGAYYMDDGGTTPPADWLSPVPVPFLTVAAGTEFRFVLAARTANAGPDVTLAARWLKRALVDLGAGGKTAAGYGYFEPLGGTASSFELVTVSPDASRSRTNKPHLLPAARGPGAPPRGADAPKPRAATAFASPPSEMRPNAKDIPARVVEVRDGKAWVVLHATNAGETAFKMEGQYNADGLMGSVVLVEIWKDEWDKKTSRPRQVRFQKNLGS